MATRWWFPLWALALVRCGGDTPPTGAVADSGAPDAPAVATCDPPERPYGTAVGQKFPALALPDCGDPENTYELYGAEFCSARVTVLSLSAGWCAACVEESGRLNRDITGRYEGQGVRLVQAIIENADRSTPTISFCQAWVQRFHLSNREVIDPQHRLNVFAGGELPGVVIFDHTGTIRFIGHAPSMMQVQLQIQNILDESP